jgi:hypothetical protein
MSSSSLQRDQSVAGCEFNSTLHIVVAALEHRDRTEFVTDLRRSLPRLEVLVAVNGYNQTETIEALLDSGLAFHNLSHMVRRWGKLATFLTKFRMLQHQVERGHPFQLTLEDDVVVRPSFGDFVQSACRRYTASNRSLDLMVLSPYTEVLLTSLHGARRLTQRMLQYGIRRNDDQQLTDARTMQHAVGIYRTYHSQSKEHRPWWQGRRTNMGDIMASDGMTWTEMQLLRLATNPAARRLPAYGSPHNPPRLKCNYPDASTYRRSCEDEGSSGVVHQGTQGSSRAPRGL